MKKRFFIRVFAMLLCAMMLLTACSSGSSGGSKQNTTPDTYETPVEILEEIMNTKKFSDFGKLRLHQLNGFAEKEALNVYKAMLKSDSYKSYVENLAESYEEDIKNKQDLYGANYKYSIQIKNKEKLEDAYLQEFSDAIKSFIDKLESYTSETDNYEEADWFDELGMTSAETKSLVKAMDALHKALKDAEVEDGYMLDLLISVNDTEEGQKSTIYVFKVNEHWISSAALADLHFAIGWH